MNGSQPNLAASLPGNNKVSRARHRTRTETVILFIFKDLIIWEKIVMEY